jgi:hypothetical protein
MEESMSIARFAAYAADFEKSFESDDWSLVESHLSKDVVYEVGLKVLAAEPIEGRDALLAYFKDVLDRFDRRFESRELNLLEGPVEEDGSVWIRGAATYRAEGVPELVLVLKETVHFEDGLICRLVDQYEPAMRQSIEEYVAAYSERLGIHIDGTHR